MCPRWLVLALSTPIVLAGCGGDEPLTSTLSTEALLETDSSATPRGGSITIVLDMQPNRPVEVPFKGRKLKDFTLDDDVNTSVPNTRTFAQLNAGRYTVQQSAVAGVTLINLTCTSSGTDNNTIDVPNRSVTIGLEQDESVVCTFVGNMSIWQNGDLITYPSDEWGNPATSAAALLSSQFNSVYPSALEVGIPDTSGFSMLFTIAGAVQAYLPATGAPDALNEDLLNPSSSPSGIFGGVVVALQLNVDFSDAGKTAGNVPVHFGDLRLCDYALTPGLNGKTVREILAIANTLLGGGTTPFTINEVALVASSLDASFDGGTVSAFAQDSLVNSASCP
jgi:hypothetical protein